MNITQDQLAWIIRTAMVAVASVCAYLLVQTDVELDAAAKVVLGIINTILAALNAGSLAARAKPAA